MYSYRDQLAIIDKIKVREGEHRTLDCPFCGGVKKFTIDRLEDGRLLWNCFKASCGVRGSKKGARSVEAAKAYVAGQRSKPIERKTSPIPLITTRVENNEIALAYLHGVNSYPAYESGLIHVRYDPKSSRVLFYNSDKSGAVGRALGRGPKWLAYGDVSRGIHVGSGKSAVLVEDVASACSVSRLDGYTGVALLGTNLSNTLKNTLQKYNSVFILLDNDATRKAAHMIKKLRGNIFLRTTDQDPKELSLSQLHDLLENKLN